MAEVVLTKDNFNEEVGKSNLPVIVDFWASWCGPCMMMGPVLAELAEELDGKIKVGKVNVDNESELAQQFGIMSIPCFILFKDGKQVATQIGAMPKDDLKSFILQN